MAARKTLAVRIYKRQIFCPIWLLQKYQGKLEYRRSKVGAAIKTSIQFDETFDDFLLAAKRLFPMQMGERIKESRSRLITSRLNGDLN
jgi:hypothetical protein